MRSAWVDVCAVDAITPDTGVCALIAGKQVAIFRLRDGSLHALGNRDPFSGAYALSRGIVGDSAGVPKVASPVHKQAFDLRTGACLEDDQISVPSYPVRTVDGRVQVLPVARATASTA